MDSQHEVAATGAARLLAEMLTEHGDLAGAVDAYRWFLTAGYPRYVAWAAMQLGSTLERMGDFTAAKTAYKRAVRTGDTRTQREAASRIRELPKRRLKSPSPPAAQQ
jgi:tetratricopeptide (TPR) repeat protein